MFNCFKNTRKKKFYSIISSYTIRPNNKFNVAVAVHKSNGPCSFEIKIRGRTYTIIKTVKVNPKSVENVVFDIPRISKGEYEIVATGLKGIIFNKSSPLRYKDSYPIVLVQLDKATYQPNDLVQFRVIFMDDNTRSLKLEQPIFIILKNSAKNILKQWKDVQLKKGVFSGKYQLSERPLLGEWQIDVAVEGRTLKTKNFDVQEYVLPKFNVSIETAKNVAISDRIINVTVRSKYTYGKNVKGKAIVGIKPKNIYEKGKNTRAVKTIDVNGKGHVQFRIGEDFNVGAGFNPRIDISVEMEEELTGNKIKASQSVTLFSQRFYIEAIQLPKEFHPQKPSIIKVAVKTINNLPVLDDNNPVKLTIKKDSQSYNDVVLKDHLIIAELTSQLDENGYATFNYVFPENINTNYDFIFQYLECESSFKAIYNPRKSEIDGGENTEFLTVKLLTKNPKFSKIVEVEVASANPIPYFFYTINARGRHLKTVLVKLPKKTKRYILNITPIFEMIPESSIFVQYVLGEELIYAGTTIKFNREFENFINITAPVVVNPGEEIQLEINSNPDSYIGLLGIDQSVLLMKEGNDLYVDDVFQCMEKFKNINVFRSIPGSRSGLVTLTNAHYPEYKEPGSVDEGRGLFQSTAFERIAQSPSIASTVKSEVHLAIDKMRKGFPETWIFDHIENCDGNPNVIKKRIPDTITSWVITGFSINRKTGFALVQNPSVIRTFRPFFITTNLPYSVKRGEQISIPVLVWNYFDYPMQVDIYLDNEDDEYDIMEAASHSNICQKTITLSSATGENVFFRIRPKIIGKITLKITAESSLVSDAIQKILKVESEGITIFKNEDIYLFAEDSMVNVKNTVELDIPPNIVPNSEYIEVTVMGNILSSTIKNIDYLVRLPNGCGEQIMMNFVPNIMILWYLERIRRLTTILEENTKRLLEVGYQLELSYKHKDGSFSAFGKCDPSGSTWLTAYVIRCFYQAKKYINIDPKVLQEGLDFLVQTQSSNGCFSEVGQVLDSSHMNEIGLTAFVLLAFLESRDSLAKYNLTITRGFDFLQENVRNTDDIYALSVALYALQQRKLDVAHEVLAKLKTLAHIGGLKYWIKEGNQKTDTQYKYYSQNHTVEITGYILMTLLDMNMPVMHIARWLISQRNSNGGYGSTQDTVVGLWALIKFAEKTGTANQNRKTNIALDIYTPVQREPVKRFSVVNENLLMTQVFKLPANTREISYLAKGIGTAVLQISYSYNVFEKEEKPNFRLSVEIHKNRSSVHFSMDILTLFLQANGVRNGISNMVVMEVALPSGYTASKASFNKIRDIDNVKYVESKADDTIIVIYFDCLEIFDQKRIPIEAELTHDVTDQKPVPIVIYDYYDNTQRATEFYQIENPFREE